MYIKLYLSFVKPHAYEACCSSLGPTLPFSNSCVVTCAKIWTQLVVISDLQSLASRRKPSSNYVTFFRFLMEPLAFQTFPSLGKLLTLSYVLSHQTSCNLCQNYSIQTLFFPCTASLWNRLPPYVQHIIIAAV